MVKFIFFNFQPVEFIKPFFILIIAQIISSNNFKSLNFTHFYFIYNFIINNIFACSPTRHRSISFINSNLDFSNFCFGYEYLFYICFKRYSYFRFFLSLIFSLSRKKFNYILSRISSFIDPSKGDGFQSQKAIDAIRLGGVKGQGMGEGILKESVPEAHTDYIIAVISEEFGSIVSILIICIFSFYCFTAH